VQAPPPRLRVAANIGKDLLLEDQVTGETVEAASLRGLRALSPLVHRGGRGNRADTLAPREKRAADSVWRDVLIEPEEVVRVVFALERL
jgi:hypothetical protein